MQPPSSNVHHDNNNCEPRTVPPSSSTLISNPMQRFLQYPITAAYAYASLTIALVKPFPHVIVDIASPPAESSRCSIHMLLYQGALDGRRSDCCESLMMGIFWRHTSQSWCWRMIDWMIWTARQSSGGRRWVLNNRSVGIHHVIEKFSPDEYLSFRKQGCSRRSRCLSSGHCPENLRFACRLVSI